MTLSNFTLVIIFHLMAKISNGRILTRLHVILVVTLLTSLETAIIVPLTDVTLIPIFAAISIASDLPISVNLAGHMLLLRTPLLALPLARTALITLPPVPLTVAQFMALVMNKMPLLKMMLLFSLILLKHLLKKYKTFAKNYLFRMVRRFQFRLRHARLLLSHPPFRLLLVAISTIVVIRLAFLLHANANIRLLPRMKMSYNPELHLLTQFLLLRNRPWISGRLRLKKALLMCIQ